MLLLDFLQDRSPVSSGPLPVGDRFAFEFAFFVSAADAVTARRVATKVMAAALKASGMREAWELQRITIEPGEGT